MKLKFNEPSPPSSMAHAIQVPCQEKSTTDSTQLEETQELTDSTPAQLVEEFFSSDRNSPYNL